MFVDTHTHLYLEEFNPDRTQVIRKANELGVSVMFLPNIDSESWNPMLDLCKDFPDNCLPMAGLHPTSVTKDNWEQELLLVEKYLREENFCAVGEIGIDLYWDKTFYEEQVLAFRQQIRIAKMLKLPVAIHMRNSFNEVWEVVKDEAGDDLKGVFHCFSGNLQQAKMVIEAGFMLGIGGVVTFKNSGLQDVIKTVGLNPLVLETDAPYLAPVPYRGQRNEPSYIPLIAAKIAEITGETVETVASVTTSNAAKLFNLSLPSF